MYNELILRMVFAILVTAALTVNFKNHRKDNENPAIAAADERERHAWRYFRWFIKALQVAAILWLINLAFNSGCF